MSHQEVVEDLHAAIVRTISQTNGITLDETLSLMLAEGYGPLKNDKRLRDEVENFRTKLYQFQDKEIDIDPLLEHPFSQALYQFFRKFPLPFREEHTHLTGALSPSFIYPKIMDRLHSPDGAAVREQISRVYPNQPSIQSEADIERMVRLSKEQRFDEYLKILILPKLILTDREAHAEAAYHMAKELYDRYNVGYLRLKFTLSRATSDETEQIPGSKGLTSEDVALGLYEGFKQFGDEQRVKGRDFDFILSPSFRKEAHHFDRSVYATKREHVQAQVDDIVGLIRQYPFLKHHLREVDTVGDEKDFYKKQHFEDMRTAFRKLQYYGFQIRSHHGETWRNLRYGIQAVDNAINVWHIDALEHGLSLGINPNYYYHSMFLRILAINEEGEAITAARHRLEYHELNEIFRYDHQDVRDKLFAGAPLNADEIRLFTKAKFHAAAEVEHYQHDVLNRMIQKGVSLMSLPSSNYKLTSYFADYKDHPFSWWEKKGLKLGVGTDNYITLNTNFLQEMLILLYTDPVGLKITKLLMVTTGETRRPYISHLLWEMQKQV